MKQGRPGADLFEWFGRSSAATAVPERRQSFKECLAESISNGQFSREQIADRMTATLGVVVTKAQLDAWTAESKSGHRFPAEYIPAFCAACGSVAPLEFMARAAGFHLVTNQERALAEIARLEAQERKIRTKRKLLQQLAGDSDD